jgi:hypothetical protein
MLSAPTLLIHVTFALAALGSCQQRPLSPIEQKVVGTWDRTGMDFTERTVYRPDRTLESTMADGSGVLPFRSGTWRVEGDVLVEEFRVHWEPSPRDTFPQRSYQNTDFETHSE